MIRELGVSKFTKSQVYEYERIDAFKEEIDANE